MLQRIYVKMAVVFCLCLFPSLGFAEEPVKIDGKTLTMKECIEIGLKTNPTSEIARQNLKILENKVGEAYAGYYPYFNLGFTYSFRDQKPQTIPNPNAGQEGQPSTIDVSMNSMRNTYNFGFSGQITLFDGLSTPFLVQGIRHQIQAQKYNVQTSIMDIIYYVKLAFYDILKTRDLVEVSKAEVARNAKHLQYSQKLFKEGLAPRSDVIKVEVQLSNAQLDQVKAENNYLRAKANLSTVMGLPVTMNFEVFSPKLELEKTPLPLMNGFIQAAYQLRPELKELKSKIQAAISTMKQSKSGYYPNISANLSWALQDNTFFPTRNSWGAGLTITIPIFDILVAKAKVKQGLANIDMLNATELSTIRKIEQDIASGWLLLKEARERLNVTKKTLEQADFDMKLSEGRYKEGVGNILEIIDAETALKQAQVNNVVAIYDIANSLTQLERFSGRIDAK